MWRRRNGHLPDQPAAAKPLPPAPAKGVERCEFSGLAPDVCGHCQDLAAKEAARAAAAAASTTT